MTQPIEYYIWIMGRISCDKWHGLKPVTRKRGDILISRYNKSWPENHYWLEPVELPEGECAHVTPEQACIYCQPKDLELI